MSKIELLVGMIASGKSTYAAERASDEALVVSHDALTAMLHSEYRYEQTLRETYLRMQEAIVKAAIDAGRDVVIDRTHLTKLSRQHWISIAANWGVPIVAVVFPRETPETHALRRYMCDHRGRSYEDWLQVARIHEAQAIAEPYKQDEGFADTWLQ